MNRILLASGQQGGFLLCCLFVFENVNLHFCWLLGGKVGLVFVVLVYFCFLKMFLFSMGSKVGLVFAIFAKILMKTSAFLKELIWF